MSDEVKAYNDGLQEAWELAKRITGNDGYSLHQLQVVFGDNVVSRLMNESPSTLLMKEREYLAHTSPLDIGDIVIKRNTASRGIILKVENGHGEYKDMKYVVVFSNGHLENLCRGEIIPDGNSIAIKSVFKELLSK